MTANWPTLSHALRHSFDFP